MVNCWFEMSHVLCIVLVLFFASCTTSLQYEKCLSVPDQPCQCKMEQGGNIFDVNQIFQEEKLPVKNIPGPNRGNFPFFGYSPCEPLITDCQEKNVAVCEYSTGWGDPDWYHYPIGSMDKPSYNVTYSGSYNNITSVEVTYSPMPGSEMFSVVRFIRVPTRTTPSMRWIKNNNTYFYFEVYSNQLKVTRIIE